MSIFNWEPQKMTPTQQRIAEYIERNLHETLLLTEHEIADRLDVSVASVSRFWRKIGYHNIKDFKRQINDKITPTPAGKIESLMSSKEDQGIVRQNFQTVMSHLELTLEHFSENNLGQAAHLINQAETIFICGQGSSAGLKELLSFRLARFGLNIKKIENKGSDLFEDLIHLEKEDLIILFYFGTNTLAEEKVLFQEALDQGIQMLVITDQLVSPMINRADINLYCSRGEAWEFHSMVAPTFMIELLITQVGAIRQDDSIKPLQQLSKLRKKYQDILPR
ncbi:MurR/RpiR family transcriptional regulator [Alloiococcus otitis]|uniref:MurR/RpiR family transcriptional regulator n=1 Tax=Alloiococcus otitis TaxID=1652 RepID=UPI00235578B2|nr:MurR/RpiR family transcriptional regulator [Alloiococcus otitis]